MSIAEREPWRQSSVATESDESALMEKVAGIVTRAMSDHYGDKLTFDVEVKRHFESWDTENLTGRTKRAGDGSIYPQLR